MLNRLRSQLTHRIHELPILILMPHSRCNCRCIMCDIWKANAEKKELSIQDIQRHVPAFQKLRVRWVVLSGGEALMHPNLWTLCNELKKIKIKVTLLTTGLLLKKFAMDVVQHLDEVIISLDGDRETHNRIRNVPHAFDKIKEGIDAIRSQDPAFRMTARCVVQKENFKEFISCIHAAHSLKLNQISFLAADVSTSAFNREAPWEADRVNGVCLDRGESVEFAEIVEKSFFTNASDYSSGFIAESPAKMRKLVQYYKAMNGLMDFPRVDCNAPWVSAVMESDGSVQPCFFLPAYGNVIQSRFEEVLNSKEAIEHRRHINVSQNSVCQKCVCSLKLPLLAAI